MALKCCGVSNLRSFGFFYNMEASSLRRSKGGDGPAGGGRLFKKIFGLEFIGLKRRQMLCQNIRQQVCRNLGRAPGRPLPDHCGFPWVEDPGQSTFHTPHRQVI